MDEELDIVVIGFNVSDRQAEAGLVRVFGLDTVRARRYLRELPVTAKRCANRATAERYANALRSIGARVELRAPGDAAHDARRTFSSLPIPAPSILAHVAESARVDRETARAIARFRANEGLDGPDPGLDVDPVNPRIPKAPPLPHDLAQMPNAALPRFERPEWMLDDPLGQGATEAIASLPHFDAEPPPPGTSAPGRSSGRPPGPAAATPVPPRPSGDSVPPQRAVGLAHAATASIRPGLGALSSWRPSSDRPPPRPDRRRLWLGAALAALLLAALAWAVLSVGSEAATEHPSAPSPAGGP
jgi:hypothetical protein